MLTATQLRYRVITRGFQQYAAIFNLVYMYALPPIIAPLIEDQIFDHKRAARLKMSGNVY